MKTLKSGIEVDSEQYYKLLEWKDCNMDLFLHWCIKVSTTVAISQTTSINTFTQEQYNELIKFAGI